MTLKTSAKTEAEKVLCLLDGFGKACVVGQRFGAANTVVVEDNTDFWFFITTDRKDQNRPRDIKAHLEKYGPAENHKLGNYITVEKVKYFTKITQRRLGWGSADATEEDVKDAVEKGDKAELLAIMPAAAQLIQRNEFEVLPRLFTDLKQERPALVDCVHTFSSLVNSTTNWVRATSARKGGQNIFAKTAMPTGATGAYTKSATSMMQRNWH